MYSMHLMDKFFTYKNPILIKFTLFHLVIGLLYTNTKNLDILSYGNNFVKYFVKHISQAYRALPA